MQIPFLIVGFALTLAPYLTSRTAMAVYECEKRQIVLDNTAIVLGRGDRDVFNFLLRVNQLLQKMEIGHHVAHRCAAATGKPECLAQDRIWEVKIRSVATESLNIARQKWAASLVAAQAVAIQRAERAFCLLRRPSRLPVLLKTCEVCGLANRFELDHLFETYQLDSCIDWPAARGVGIFFNQPSLRRGPWNYAIQTED